MDTTSFIRLTLSRITLQQNNSDQNYAEHNNTQQHYIQQNNAMKYNTQQNDKITDSEKAL
jgi:hypothetical protein